MVTLEPRVRTVHLECRKNSGTPPSSGGAEKGDGCSGGRFVRTAPLPPQRMGTIIPVEDIETLGDIITNYDQIVAGMGHGMSSNNAKFNEELEKLVDELY